MTPSEPFAALAPVATAFESLGVPYYIGGSIASVHHGVPRSTMDIDVVAGLGPEHVDRFIASLDDDYYVDPTAMHRAVEARTSFNLIHLPTMFKVDVFIAPPGPFQAAVQSRAEPALPSDADRVYPIATAEDTILTKLQWYRQGGETSERQWRDILGIIGVQGRQLDHTYLRTWAPELGLDDLLEKALADDNS